MSELIAEPGVGLRRRRRAVPDEGLNTGVIQDEANNDEDSDSWNNHNRGPRDPPPARRVRRLVPPPAPIRTARPSQRRARRTPTHGGPEYGSSNKRITQLYCAISTICAILAIVIAPSKSKTLDADLHGVSFFAASSSQWSSIELITKAALTGMAARRGELAELDANDMPASIHEWWNAKISQHYDKKEAERAASVTESLSGPFWWWRHGTQQDGQTRWAGGTPKAGGTENLRARASRIFWSWIDPSRVLHLSATTPTEIIDNILTSVPRLVAIANFMMTITYILHYAIASWFLGDHANISAVSPGAATAGSSGAGDWSSPSRETIGGFFVFKLLLISSVVAPDTLDLLILLSWYTTLTCLRSLDHLAHAATTHRNAVGQPPHAGVLHLLLLVMMGNIIAAVSCVALFHEAGWGMVLLLTCDCASLATDVLSHILKYFTCYLEDIHSHTIQSLEARQLDLHNSINNRGRQVNDTNSESSEHVNFAIFDETTESRDGKANDATDEDLGSVSADQAWHESRQLDRQMESLELAHSRQLSILDNAIFLLDLLYHALAVSHFCHIWSLHGVQFTLIDAVLALHLHSAISSACRKIAQRRNINCIARALQDIFTNASDEELRKAYAAGDVCCICLGTMSTGGHVKKVPCGHLYHTHCLREVVGRAQSIEAAKCPLCRSSLLNGRRQSDDVHGARNPRAGLVQQAPMAARGVDIQHQQGVDAGNHALIRFSTEDILPDWLPVPAFSFEIVRRNTTAPSPAAAPIVGRPNRLPSPGQVDPSQADDEAGAENFESVADQDPGVNIQEDTPSFLRRFLILAGAIPMSPEEEARSLANLVDMFPQYERNHLLHELRQRGSAEAVVDAIMMGVFTSGFPRGGA